MALKAGLVGVNPKGVDKNGMPKAGDTYTKLEINQMMSSYVPVSQLRANNKDFNFAYDSTTEKYGYKAGADGEFVPFEGAGVIGMNLPDAIMTGVTLASGIELVKGGYQFDDNGVLYFDITVTNNGSSSVSAPLSGMPNTLATSFIYWRDTDLDKLENCTAADTNRSYVHQSYHLVEVLLSAGESGRFIGVGR